MRKLLQQMDRQQSLTLLVHKIKLLRSKLISYGYSNCEVNAIILDNFLNVPCHADWYELGNTSVMYLLKQNLNLDASVSELVMNLIKFFRSSDKAADQTPDEFLNQIKGNSVLFGIDLSNSSSESAEHQGYTIKAARLNQRWLSKPDKRKSVAKRVCQGATHEDLPRKKHHVEQKRPGKRLLEDRQVVEEDKPDKKLKKG